MPRGEVDSRLDQKVADQLPGHQLNQGGNVEIPEDAYVSQVAMSNCKWCGRDKDLRLGVCFDCAEAQTILVSGHDMYDQGIGGIELPVKEVTERLQMLIKKGWQFKEPINLTKKVSQ